MIKNITKLEQSELSRLKKIVKTELELMKSTSDTKLQIAHLEKILEHYIKIHEIQPPTFGDKMTLKMIQTQYKGLCLIKKVKPNKNIL